MGRGHGLGGALRGMGIELAKGRAGRRGSCYKNGGGSAEREEKGKKSLRE